MTGGGTINGSANYVVDVATAGNYSSFYFVSEGTNNWTIAGEWRSSTASILSITPITSGDSPYAASWDELVLCDTTGGNITVQLPAPTNSSGKLAYVKRLAGANDVLIGTPSGQNIDGVANYPILWEQFQGITFTTDGTNYWCVGLNEFPYRDEASGS